MRLVLQIPSTWQRTRMQGQDVVALPGFAGRPDLVMAYGPMVPLPIDDAGWIDQVLRVEAGAAKLEIEPHTNEQASLGWPFKLFKADVLVDGKLIEQRLGAFFRFLEWGAAVIVRSTNPARFAGERAAIVDVLRTASMDTSGRVYCVEDLFAGLSEAAPTGAR